MIAEAEEHREQTAVPLLDNNETVQRATGNTVDDNNNEEKKKKPFNIYEDTEVVDGNILDDKYAESGRDAEEN